MSASAEEVTQATKKAVKKTPKKAAPKKVVAKKPVAKKAPTKKVVAKKAVADKPARAKKFNRAPVAPGKRGRPAGKKTTTRRVKKGAKQYAYLLLTPQEGGETKGGPIQGPFSTEAGAVEDASIMAEDNTTIVLFRETKRGRVQKQTKFVSGR